MTTDGRSRDRFAAVPAAWEEWQRDFTPTARAVYVALLLAMHRGTGIVRLSLRALAERSGLSRDQVNRGLRDLVSAGVVTHHPGSNSYAQTVIEVLLRRGAVLPARQYGVASARQQHDSASHQRDSASHQRDSNTTAHNPSPAPERPRGLEVLLDDEEGAAHPPADLPASGSPGACVYYDATYRLCNEAVTRNQNAARYCQRTPDCGYRDGSDVMPKSEDRQ